MHIYIHTNAFIPIYTYINFNLFIIVTLLMYENIVGLINSCVPGCCEYLNFFRFLCMYVHRMCSRRSEKTIRYTPFQGTHPERPLSK